MVDVRRDQYGRYLCVPPTGGKPVGYTRATTPAKTLDDGGGLLPWKATMAVTGLMRRPGLRASWEALIADSDGDPWYHSLGSKKAAKKLVEECAKAGGSADRADIGTALHALIAQMARGVTPIVSQATSRADLAAYRMVMDAAGIVIDPDTVETTVVYDEYRVAGTADMLNVTVPDIGRMVADVKTGANLDYSWQAITVQLATYAAADNIYIQGDNPDGSEDRRLPMPAISQEHGLVIHLPAGEARCDLYLIDLVAGREAFHHSMWTRAWRKRRDLARVHQFAARGSPLVQPAGEGTPIPSPAIVATVEPPPFDGALSAAPPALSIAGVEQPAGDVELPLTSPAKSMLQEGILATEHRRQLTEARQQPTVDEGGDVDKASIDALSARFRRLDPDDRSRIVNIVAEATELGYPLSLKEWPSRRRWEIMRGLVLWCEAGWNDTYVRACVAHIVGNAVVLQAVVTLGAAFGALTIDEARQLGELAQQVIDGRLTPDPDSDRLIPVA